MASPPRSIGIPEFYAGRAVFITGGSGFMGKVLVERLLATCPDIGRVYLLLREKRGVGPEERLLALKASPVFDVLREKQPKQLDKLVLVPGDVTKPLLGLSQESLDQMKEVSLVFHSAATVRFYEDLRVAVDQNVKSVIRVMDLCDMLGNIEALAHVSTGFSNSERSYIEEKVYPTPIELQKLLDYVDSTKNITEEETLKITSPKPNTYAFTKAMGEMALVQRVNRNYPIAIFRPTIVVSSMQHPFPGWVENPYGPAGVTVGSAKGLLRVYWSRPNAVADFLPVDIAIDLMIAGAWETAIDKPRDIRVYNCSTISNPCRWWQFQEALNHDLVKYPVANALWYPHVAFVNNPFMFKISEFLLQTIPHYLVAYTGRLFGNKSSGSIIKASEQLRQMNRALSYFSRQEWRFAEGNVERLRKRIGEQDKAVYNLDPRTIDWKKQLANYVRGTRQYILKEKLEDLDNARRRMRRLYYSHKALKPVLFCVLGASVFSIVR